jgi:hypothetical protein
VPTRTANGRPAEAVATSYSTQHDISTLTSDDDDGDDAEDDDGDDDEDSDDDSFVLTSRQAKQRSEGSMEVSSGVKAWRRVRVWSNNEAKAPAHLKRAVHASHSLRTLAGLLGNVWWRSARHSNGHAAAHSSTK